jgi:hypothetical protein
MTLKYKIQIARNILGEQLSSIKNIPDVQDGCLFSGTATSKFANLSDFLCTAFGFYYPSRKMSSL